MHASAKSELQDIWMAATLEHALTAFSLFVSKHGAKYPKAVNCLEKDRDQMLAFYAFPAEHWRHIRTTNPIESMFATVRLRHRRTKGSGSRNACLAMVYKLAEAAAKTWRKLNGSRLLQDIIKGVSFQDGIKAEGSA
jgi:putative transposase